MAVIFPPRDQPKRFSRSKPTINFVFLGTTQETKSSAMFAIDMEEEEGPFYPSNPSSWHGSLSASPKVPKGASSRQLGRHTSRASSAEKPESGPSKETGKGKAKVLPDRGKTSMSVDRSASRGSQRSNAASADRQSTHSQAIESASDLALGAPALETGSDQPQRVRTPNSRTISEYLRESMEKLSADWDFSDGVTLHIHKLPPPTTPDAKNTLIRRRGSTRLSPDDYRPLLSTVEDHDALAVSRARIAMLEDWIHYHEFKERSTDALDLVTWSKVQPFERKLAVLSARFRARAELKRYFTLRDQSPVLKDDDEPINLKSFADSRYGDTTITETMDIDNLDPNDAGFGSDRRLPRTIVVLARVYHQILRANIRLEEDARQWMLFLSWLSESPETRQRDPSKLVQMGIDEHILKEGACQIAKSIYSQLSDYEALRESANDKYRIQLPVIADVNHEIFGILPQGCWDICKISPKNIRELSLSPQVEGNSHEQSEMLKQRLSGDFRRSLAFRATTLIELQFKVIRARNVAETGVVEPEVECDDSEDDDDGASDNGYISSGVMGHGGR